MAFGARGSHSAPRDAQDHEAFRDLSSRILRTSQLNFGQNFGTVWRHSDGVLKMRGGFSIGGHNGPTVFEDFHLVGSQIDHRLDSKDKPRSDFWAFAVLRSEERGVGKGGRSRLGPYGGLICDV